MIPFTIHLLHSKYTMVMENNLMTNILVKYNYNTWVEVQNFQNPELWKRQS